MYIKQAPKLLLSLLLCLSATVSGAEKMTKPAEQAAAKAMDKSDSAKPQKSTKPAKAGTYPRRGMSMKQVRKHYGQPESTRKSKGKVKKQWPRITVWNYGKYSVYFERHIVLHTVVH